MKPKIREPKFEETGEKQETQSEETQEAVGQPETKAATEPWSPTSAPDHASKRGTLGLPHGKKGFELRWVRIDAVDRRKYMGYVLATPADFDATPDENGMIRRNELVLMVVPKDVYDARRKEVAEKTKLQTTAPRKEFLREREKASRQSGHNLSDKEEDQ